MHLEAMPRIRVKLFANFREFAKTKELYLRGSTVKEVLQILCQRFPGFENLLFHDRVLQPFINIFLNGKSILECGGLEAPLHENDEIAIFPPVSGG